MRRYVQEQASLSGRRIWELFESDAFTDEEAMAAGLVVIPAEMSDEGVCELFKADLVMETHGIKKLLERN